MANGVMVVYSQVGSPDVKARKTTWAQVERFPNHERIILLTVLHVQSAVTRQVQFGGHDLFYVHGKDDGLLVGWRDMSKPQMQKEFAFDSDSEEQEFNMVVPQRLREMRVNSAHSVFLAYPFDLPDFAAKEELALDIDHTTVPLL